MINLKNDV
ncbi:hypothetical protein LINPERPRIM_LOCUS7200 [Linum perenne]